MSFSLDYEKDLLSSNCIYYGPIRFYRWRGKAPTLLTGQRSRFEQVNEEEQFKRDLQRQKKRFLSKKLKEKRENIENELIQQIKQLEEKEFHLNNFIEPLQLCKKELIDKLQDAHQDALVNLINQKQIPLFFQQFEPSFLHIDSLINAFTDEQLSINQFSII